MRVTITESFTFEAAHRLPFVPEGHKCGREHGHSYKVRVQVSGEPDERGFVVDYAELARAWQPLHDAIDHRRLNDVDGLENPTTEVLAPWILRMFAGALVTELDLPAERVHEIAATLVVRVYESLTTWCEVRVEDMRQL